MNIEILAAAESEIDEAYNYYERQAEGLGTQFLDELLHIFKKINVIRKHGQILPAGQKGVCFPGFFMV